MRPIDADELKITLTNWIRLHWDEAFTADDMAYAYLEMINEELTLKMKPVVHAHWDVIDQDSEGDEAFVHVWETLRCSRCGAERTTEDGYMPQYCEDCGAKMDEEGKVTK